MIGMKFVCHMHLGITGWLVLYKHIFFDATAPQWALASLFTRFLDHKQRRTTVGRTPDQLVAETST